MLPASRHGRCLRRGTVQVPKRPAGPTRVATPWESSRRIPIAAKTSSTRRLRQLLNPRLTQSSRGGDAVIRPSLDTQLPDRIKSHLCDLLKFEVQLRKEVVDRPDALEGRAGCVQARDLIEERLLQLRRDDSRPGASASTSTRRHITKDRTYRGLYSKGRAEFDLPRCDTVPALRHELELVERCSEALHARPGRRVRSRLAPGFRRSAQRPRGRPNRCLARWFALVDRRTHRTSCGPGRTAEP